MTSDSNPLANSYATLWPTLAQTRLAPLVDELHQLTEQRCLHPEHGEASAWYAALAALPLIACDADMTLDAVTATPNAPLAEDARAVTEQLLQQLHPWRKGPFGLAGIDIDTEWRSDLKWRRLAPLFAARNPGVVLDVGAGNGYYALRLLGAGARAVVGVDPSLLYCVQAAAVNHFLNQSAAHVLPLRFEALPGTAPLFDTVLSMGVLYHQRSPQEHLAQLRRWLVRGGQLVLETLIVAGDERTVLTPTDRYARMRNVWFIPSIAALTIWLARNGFEDVRCIDVAPTNTDEQRSTPWMRFESLREALDPQDANRTVEGLPAPVRAVFTATNP